ncbi:hypothetical protein HOY82DRAFT_542061 [Tuber indicum]|nr:hypothetical protein HOY82DRAFT_542061 [Tuber indicum]
MGFPPILPNAIDIVQEGVAAGILLRPRDDLDASDEESIDENAWISPPVDNETALHYRDGRKTQQTTIHRFFKLSASESTTTSNRVGGLYPVHHNPGYSIGDWRVGGKDKGKGRETEKNRAGFGLNWDLEAEYLTTGNNTEEDEDHATCVPTSWKTKSVNAAYKNLLK